MTIEETMEQAIREELYHFSNNDPGNRFPESNEPYFDNPIIGFADATDPLFTDYKTVIGTFHLTPHELITNSSPHDIWTPATVISWVLPITKHTRASNRLESQYPSQRWAETRNFGEQFNTSLRRHLVAWLESKGFRAAAPQLLSAWHEFPESPVGIASSWSERHAAYAAGLGTFSLTDALITPKGIAHRLGSVITDLKLEPSQRPYPERRANCLHFREGTCGACMARCPVGAITRDGHNKYICREYVYQTIPKTVAERYRVTATGCGLCQTKVPCEGCIPEGRKKSK